MKVNQLSQGFPQYLSHTKSEYHFSDQKSQPVRRRVEFNEKRNHHQNIFSDQYHFLPSTQVKNPFLRQEFKIGEVKQNWVKLVDEKVLPPVEVYDCVLDQVQTVPRETIFMKNKDLYPQYYEEALKEGGKKEFRRVSGAFMQQIQEINKMKPFLDIHQTPSKGRNESKSSNDYYNNSNGSNYNISSRLDMSSDDKCQKSYSYNSRPSILKQSMLMEKSNFFTPNFKEDDNDVIEEKRRNLYLRHDPKYINSVEHQLNKESIQDSMKQKSKSMVKLNRDLRGQITEKSNKIIESNTPSMNSLEKISDLKRSIEFQQFEDELTKFEKSLKANKKTNCVWMVHSNSKSLNRSQFMQQSNMQEKQQSLQQQSPQFQQYYQQSQSAQSTQPLQLKTHFSLGKQNSTKKIQESNSPEIQNHNSNPISENINTPSFTNLYNFNFKPTYSSQQKLDSPIESQNELAAYNS